MTTDPIQQTRALLTKGIFPEDVGNALNLLPALNNEAERWQAMAIGERAHRVAYENNVPLSEYRDRAMCYAARELRAESSSWRKIGPVERVALEIATGDRPLTDDIFYLDKLKKLLEGT